MELVAAGEFNALIDAIEAAYEKKQRSESEPAAAANDDATAPVVATAASATSSDPPRRQQLLVAIAGVPGSGKTTLTKAVVETLNQRHNNCNDDGIDAAFAVGVPMDGYHKYRAELAAMPNAEEAFLRRGVHWTFAPDKLLNDLTALKATGGWAAPTFDHAERDPVEGGVVVTPGNSIVVVEGIYLTFCGTPEWAAVCNAFDLRVFIDVSLATSTERLTVRHQAAWNMSREEALLRSAGSDLDNARVIVETKGNAHMVLHSRDATNL